MSELINAAKNGRLEDVRKYIRLARNRSLKGKTALMYAAEKGYVDCVEALIPYEATLRTSTGLTALGFAIQQNHQECVDLLFPYEGKIPCKEDDYETNSYDSTEFSHGKGSSHGSTSHDTQQIDYLTIPSTRVYKCANLVVEREEMQTLVASLNEEKAKLQRQLMLANQQLGELQQNIETLEKTKALAENTHTKLENDNKRLKQMLFLGESEIARLNTQVIELTRKVTTLNADCSRKKPSAEEQPPGSQSSTLALINAAINGDVEQVRNHINQACISDSDGMTALMHAAAHGHAHIVSLLRPTEIRMQDKRGWTALMYALKGVHMECIKLLRSERDIVDHESGTVIGLFEEVQKSSPQESEIMLAIMAHLRLKIDTEELLPKPWQKKYVVIDRLGEGVSGRVYVIYDAVTKLNYALKVINRDVTASEMERERVAIEVNMSFSNHPNILSYVDTHINEHKVYIVLPWLPNTLEDKIERRAANKDLSFSETDIRRYIYHIAKGLAYLHAHSWMHRNLRPANVLLNEQDECYIADFGLTHTLEPQEITQAYTKIQLYIAPEIHNKKHYQMGTDIWALGVIAYELCAGKRPFSTVKEVLQETPQRLKGVSEELQNLIFGMLDKELSTRFTAKEICKRLYPDRL